MFSSEEKISIAQSILKRLNGYHCPMCAGTNFSILEEYGLQNISTFGNIENSQHSVATPYIMLICANCGFMSKHNMFVLGLMDEKKIESIKLIGDIDSVVTTERTYENISSNDDSENND